MLTDVGGTPVVTTGGTEGAGFSSMLLVILVIALLGGDGFGGNGRRNGNEFNVWDVGKSQGDIEAAVASAKFDTVTELLDTDKIIMGAQYALGTQIMETNLGLSNKIAETNLGLSSRIDACCCKIQNTIRDDGDATRSLITNNIIQELRDRAESAEFQNSQYQQNAYLLSKLQPNPVPSYPTASPYVGTGNFYGCGGCC